MSGLRAALAFSTLSMAALAVGGFVYLARPVSKSVGILELSLPGPSFKRRASEILRADGFDCPELKAVYLVRSEKRDDEMRAVCRGLSAPDFAGIRLIVRQSGPFRAEPRNLYAVNSAAGQFSLRSSFD